MSENKGLSNASFTLCWDCSFATGGCSWSDELKPINGWTAKRVTKQTQDSYMVYACPLFSRDALNYGRDKLYKGDEK